MTDMQSSSEPIDLALLFTKIDEIRRQIDEAIERGDSQASQQLLASLQRTISGVDDRIAWMSKSDCAPK